MKQGIPNKKNSNSFSYRMIEDKNLLFSELEKKSNILKLMKGVAKGLQESHCVVNEFNPSLTKYLMGIRQVLFWNISMGFQVYIFVHVL